MFPIYCNKCYRRLELEKMLKFYISRCCHIACGECRSAECVVCRRPYQGIEINSETMPASVADCFADSMVILKRYERAVKFQWDQRALLYKYYETDQQKKQKELEQNNAFYSEGIQKLRETIESEKTQIQKLKEYIAYQERCDEVGFVGEHTRPRSDRGSCRLSVCSPRTPSLNLTHQTNSSGEDMGAYGAKTHRETSKHGGSNAAGGGGFNFSL